MIIVGRKQQEIKVDAYVNIGETLVDIDSLTKQQRDYIGKVLNYQGVRAALGNRGVAKPPKLPPIEEVFAEYLKKYV